VSDGEVAERPAQAMLPYAEGCGLGADVLWSDCDGLFEEGEVWGHAGEGVLGKLCASR